MYNAIAAGVALTALVVQMASGQTPERNGLVVRLEVGEVATGLTASQLAFVYDSGRRVRADFLPAGWFTNAWNGTSQGTEDPNLVTIMCEGRLHAVEEPTGRYVFSYDPNGLLERVSHTSREWRLEYKDGQLVRIAVWRSGLNFGGLKIEYAKNGNVWSVLGDYMSYGLLHWTGSEWRVVEARDQSLVGTSVRSDQARTSAIAPAILIPPWSIKPPPNPPLPDFHLCNAVDPRYPIQAGPYPAPPEYYYWIRDGWFWDEECRGRVHLSGFWDQIMELGCSPGTTTGPVTVTTSYTITKTFGVGVGVYGDGTGLSSAIQTDESASRSYEFCAACCRVTRLEPPPPVVFQTCNRRWFQRAVTSTLIWDTKVNGEWSAQPARSEPIRVDAVVDVNRCDECDCDAIR